jgi:hypothetical protein
MSAYDFIAADKKLIPLEIGVEDKGYTIVIEDEGHTLRIFEDEPSSYTEPFTVLPVIMSVQIGNYSSVEVELFDYLKNSMADNDNLEIWATWMEEAEGAEKITRHIDELSIDDVHWVFGDNSRKHPRGLKVFKWIRGKK